MSVILTSVLILGGIGVVGAAVLYVVANRFKVEEDPRIDEVEALLPGANCGGCGRSGCRDFAAACVKATSLDSLVCPASGSGVMKRIGEIVGLAAAEGKPRVAVLKCNGICSMRTRVAAYDGPPSCAIESFLGCGESACPVGCLGCGDCVKACPYDALHLDAATGLPVVDADACTGCGVCVKSCPRRLIELRLKGPRGMRVWVACSNHEKGAVARKDCKAACIGCGKCLKTCPHGAITLSDNLAYIDCEKCRLCGKCVAVCPTGAIQSSFKVPTPTTEN